MKKLLFLLVAAVTTLQASADEGMWFLMHLKRLNQADMQKMGLQLTAEEIYSINNSSLKDAIVQFGGGCTAEMISKDGLVLTNHHCGYGAIAELSSAENDYLTNGFWAQTRQQELKPKELKVRFFVRMDDVTDRILGKVNDGMSEAERNKAIANETALIEKENSENGKYVVSVASFYNGNEFYYFVYQDYTDVRLVGTPPNSIGKFGGDTDNWEWPRHTGDFALFRVYADKDGNPAPFSANNVPLKPKYHLPISLKGFRENDFAMILGYPGRTNRWMPSGGIEQNVNFSYPAWVEASKTGMDAMKKYMDQDKQVRIDYASKYAQVANYWKNRQGMIDALSQHQTAKAKKKEEVQFNKWANKPANRERYGDVMATLDHYYVQTNENGRHDNYLMGMLRSSNLALIPFRIGSALLYYQQQGKEVQERILPQIQEEIDNLYKGFYLPLEKEVLAAELNLYAAKAGDELVAPYIEELKAKNGGDFTAFIEQAGTKSIFASKEKVHAFLAKPDVAALQNDELFKLSNDIINRYRSRTPEQEQLDADFQRAFRLYTEGVLKANPKKKYYPDANSTLRLTYGKIRSLPKDPRNDAKKNYYTTLKGTVAKYQPGDDEFDLPQELIALYEAGDYGRYADKDGHLSINFLTDNDITGGNSGSPVINGNGELIGIAFDGNIEAMAGDVIFDKKLQRCINVDIRYVLFIIDKFAGASHLIDEMTLVE